MKHGFRLEDMIGVLMALARLLGDHQEVAALEGSLDDPTVVWVRGRLTTRGTQPRAPFAPRTTNPGTASPASRRSSAGTISDRRLASASTRSTYARAWR